MNETFKALSDPTRRQILRLLRQRDMTAGEIADHFSLTKPSISHHLNSLKQAKLVLDERHGQQIVYSLNTTVVQEVMGWFMEILSTKEKREDETHGRAEK
jgi:DNA-binding transcriptional ArsR family regulator